jgi:hypothetical protein
MNELYMKVDWTVHLSIWMHLLALHNPIFLLNTLRSFSINDFTNPHQQHTT